MKKLIALILALVTVLSLTACGERTDNSEGTDNFTSGNDSDSGSTASAGAASAIQIKDVRIDNTSYGDDGSFTMNVTVDWEGTPEDNAWIGIIPADVEHGSEEKNDEYDISYLYFNGMKSGDTFVFENITLEPGDYTLRINESDDGGAELAWCGFSVSGRGKVKTDGSKATILSNQQQNQDGGNAGTEAAEKAEVPEGYEKYVNQGAVLLYPTDKYQKGMMGGIEQIEGEAPWVRLSILGDSFDEQKSLCEQEHASSSDYSLTEITVGEHRALKCIYSDSASYYMEVIIDTSFINDPFWASIAVKVDIPKSKGDLSTFEDETLWEIINSFYFDSSLKYSF